ncbi:hypothetical protein [Chryseobacterium lactis]|uniref:hypothetical protein n=1 Tax=Chryseobacterium lactis TaxID=1241981 RepID=UPI001625EC96|nr:hypothetical protein [Chryseobacterium lactis]
MEIITDLEHINEILREAHYDTARIWLFDITHVKLAVKLYSYKNENVMYLILPGCQYMKGPFTLKFPQLSVKRHINKETSEVTFTVVEANADFQLVSTGGIILAMGEELEFGDSFEGFLKK